MQTITPAMQFKYWLENFCYVFNILSTCTIEMFPVLFSKHFLHRKYIPEI